MGHMARSLALKETPKMVSKWNNRSKKSSDKNQDDDDGGGEKRKSQLAFGNNKSGTEENNDGEVGPATRDEERDRNLSLLGDAIRSKPANKKMKLSTSGGSGSGGGKNVQKRMMEAAMMMQGQEFM